MLDFYHHFCNDILPKKIFTSTRRQTTSENIFSMALMEDKFMYPRKR